MTYATNSELPAGVLREIFSEDHRTAFREVYNMWAPAVSDLLAVAKGYLAAEEAGWVAKDDPTASDVHIDAALGAKKPRRGPAFRLVSVDVAKRISGNSNIPLNVEGCALARRLGERIAAKGGLDVLYSSTLKRGIETADAIAAVAAKGSIKRAAPDPGLNPWRFPAIEGRESGQVKHMIRHYVENPDEVPPGKCADGDVGESFHQAVKRQLDFHDKIYKDFEEDPTLKIGLIEHGRGMDLLQAWVDEGMPDDYRVDVDDLLHPDDPNHATMLRWHKEEIDEVDLDDDSPLKPGVYPILHSLTADDTDDGNEDLEKIDPWIGVDLDKTLAHYDGDVGTIGAPIPAMAERVKVWLKDGKAVKIFTARVADDPDEKQKGMIEDWCERHFGQKLPVTNAKDRGMTELWDDRAVGVEPNTGAIKKFHPPVEVAQAARSAWEAGNAVVNITAELVEGSGLTLDAVRDVAKHFRDSASATEPASVRDAWGGGDAQRWAERVIAKYSEDQPRAANGEFGEGGSVEGKVSARVQRAIDAQVRTGQKEQAVADRSEAVLSKALGLPRTKDNSAFDLRNDDVGIEIKTLVTGKNEKITMSKAALGRKLAEQQADGLKGYTVVADRRLGGNSPARYYVKEGFGSFRIGSMQPVTLAQLKEIVTR